MTNPLDFIAYVEFTFLKNWNHIRLFSHLFSTQIKLVKHGEFKSANVFRTWSTRSCSRISQNRNFFKSDEAAVSVRLISISFRTITCVYYFNMFFYLWFLNKKIDSSRMSPSNNIIFSKNMCVCFTNLIGYLSRKT